MKRTGKLANEISRNLWLRKIYLRHWFYPRGCDWITQSRRMPRGNGSHRISFGNKLLSFFEHFLVFHDNLNFRPTHLLISKISAKLQGGCGEHLNQHTGTLWLWLWDAQYQKGVYIIPEGSGKGIICHNSSRSHRITNDDFHLLHLKLLVQVNLVGWLVYYDISSLVGYLMPSPI